MPRFDPVAFGTRLRLALEERGWNIEQLQKALRRRTGGVRGTSYGTVWAMVHGKAASDGPRQEAISALAELLDRLPGFLLYGEGPMTERQKQAERQRQAAAGDGPDPATPWHERYQAIDAGMKRQSPLWETADYYYATEPLIQGLVIDLLESGGEDFLAWSAEDIEEVTFMLVQLIALPLLGLRIGEPVDVSPMMPKWPEYFAAMAMAIRAALPKKGQGHPREIVKSLRTKKPKPRIR